MPTYCTATPVEWMRASACTTAGTWYPVTYITGAWTCGTTTSTSTAYLSGESPRASLEAMEAMAFHQQRIAEAEAASSIVRKEARARALRLLMAHLAPAQRRSLRKDGYFDVRGADGLMRRLYYAYHGNYIIQNAEGEADLCYCGHFGESLPVADTLLAQLLMVRSDPALYEANANRVHTAHWARPHQNYAVEIEEAMAA